MIALELPKLVSSLNEKHLKEFLRVLSISRKQLAFSHARKIRAICIFNGKFSLDVYMKKYGKFLLDTEAK